MSFHKKRKGGKEKKIHLPHFVQNGLPPYATAEGEPAFLFTFWDAACFPLGSLVWSVGAKPCGVDCEEELPPPAVELISGPKHTLQLAVQTVSLTFDSRNTNGSLGEFHILPRL